MSAEQLDQDLGVAESLTWCWHLKKWDSPWFSVSLSVESIDRIITRFTAVTFELYLIWGRLLFVLSSSLVLSKCAGALFSSKNQPVPLLRHQHYYFSVGKPCICALSPPFLTLFFAIHYSPFPTFYIWYVFFKLNMCNLLLFSGIGVKAKRMAELQWETSKSRSPAIPWSFEMNFLPSLFEFSSLGRAGRNPV